MATNATVPSAAPAVAAPTATPAASPAPVSTPSPAATPSPATGALSHDQSVNAMLEAAKGAGFSDDLSKPATEAAPADATPSAETTPAKEGEVAAAPAAAAQEEEPEYSLDEDGFVGAKDMAAKLADANLDPATRNEILANSRLAERGAAYEKIFASPAEAQIAVETSQAYAGFSEAFSMVGQDPEQGTTHFINKLIEGSALRDDNGEIIRDANGHIVTDGTASKFLVTVGKRWMNVNVVRKIEELAAKGDENVKAALDLVMESVGLLPSTAGKTTDGDPAIAARKAELDAQEARIRQERESSTQAATKEYKEALDGDLNSLYETESGKILGLATALDDFAKTAARQQIDAAFKAAIKKNTAYQMKRNEIRQRPMSAARRAAEVQHAKNFTRDNLARIAAPILRKAGVSVKGKAEATAAAQAARAENARSEVNGGAVAQPAGRASGTNLTPQQEYAAAEQSWRAANPGREPKGSDITVHMMLQNPKLKGIAA